MRLGEHDRYSSTESDHVDIEASQIINHPDFSRWNLQYDFTMIKLAKPIDFAANPHIRPICLPNKDSGSFEGVTATVTGWGWTGTNNARMLQEVDVTVLSQYSCRNDYGYAPWRITDDMLCAAVPNGGQDSCWGDSGKFSCNFST